MYHFCSYQVANHHLWRKSGVGRNCFAYHWLTGTIHQTCLWLFLLCKGCNISLLCIPNLTCLTKIPSHYGYLGGPSHRQTKVRPVSHAHRFILTYRPRLYDVRIVNAGIIQAKRNKDVNPRHPGTILQPCMTVATEGSFVLTKNRRSIILQGTHMNLKIIWRKVKRKS